MNDLNSILLEGVVFSEPLETDNSCEFTIMSHRYYKTKDDIKEETSYAKIEPCNKRLAETCITTLHIGRKIRVVGRFKQAEIEGQSTIIAEHIEFRPVHNA
jgi:single-stranded DNA-binding protein